MGKTNVKKKRRISERFNTAKKNGKNNSRRIPVKTDANLRERLKYKLTHGDGFDFKH